MARKKRQNKVLVKKKTQIPLGVKVISVLNYIGAAILLLLFIAFLMSGIGILSNKDLGDQLVNQINSQANSLNEGFKEITYKVLGVLFIILSVLFIGLAILMFFLGRGLWKGQEWARITEIVLAFFGTILSISDLIGGNYISVMWLLVDVLIGSYLLFSKEVRRTFSR